MIFNTLHSTFCQLDCELIISLAKNTPSALGPGDQVTRWKTRVGQFLLENSLWENFGRLSEGEEKEEGE